MKRDNRLIAVIALLCFFGGLLFRQDETYKLTAGGVLLSVAAVAIYNIVLYIRKAAAPQRRLAAFNGCCVLFFLFAVQGMSWLRGCENIKQEVLSGGTILLFLLFAAAFFVCMAMERGITENTIVIVIFSGFLLRLFYVVMTQGHLLQNDIGNLSDSSVGHLGYVYRIFSTGQIPWGDPTGLYEFCQPPLHYIISAAILRLYVFLGAGIREGDEILQLVSVFYSTTLLIFLDKIAVRMRCSLPGRFVTLSLAAFLPYSIYMGGAVNNDMLTALLMVMCVYFTLKWYEEPNLKNILVMALCVGCAMLTKLSGAIIAPAMALVMLWKAWSERGQWKKWFGQFACFGLVAFPLGLGYYLLRLLQFGTPLGFVVPIPTEDPQFIGMYVGATRFRGFSHALENLSLRWGPAPDVDYNIPISLVKYCVFNELSYYTSMQATRVLGTLVFWGTVFWFAMFGTAFILWCLLSRKNVLYKVFLGTGGITMFIIYVKFCMEYPYVCSMNVRYIIPAVYLGMLAFGGALSALSENRREKTEQPEKAEKQGRTGQPEKERTKGKLRVKTVLKKAVVMAAVVGAAAYSICSILLNIHLERLLF